MDCITEHSQKSLERIAASVAQSPHLTALDLKLLDNAPDDPAGMPNEVEKVKMSAQCLAEALVHHSSPRRLGLGNHFFYGPVASAMLAVLSTLQGAVSP